MPIKYSNAVSDTYSFESARAKRCAYVGHTGPEFAGRTAFARPEFFDYLPSYSSLEGYISRIPAEGKTRKGRTLFSSALSSETGLDIKIASLYALPGMSAKSVVKMLGDAGINISETSVRRVAKRVLNDNPSKRDTYGIIAGRRNPISVYALAA